jgi:hypothetical protein
MIFLAENAEVTKGATNENRKIRKGTKGRRGEVIAVIPSPIKNSCYFVW